MVTVYSGPRNARTDPDSGLRWYRWVDAATGEIREVPSVTSIRSMAGAPYNLMRWYVSRVCDRAVDEMDHLGALMSRPKKAREQKLEENRRKEARAWLRAAPEEERDYKALRGTAVHAAAEAGLAPEEVRDYVKVKMRRPRRDEHGVLVMTTAGKQSVETIERSGWDPLAIDVDAEVLSTLVIPASEIIARLRQDIAWLDSSGFETLVAEGQVWNLTLGYAGSFDRLGRFPNGEVWIVDIKTGDDSYSDYVLQQCGYLMAEFVGRDGVRDDEATALLHQVAGIAILHLHESSWEFLRIDVDAAAWQAFQGLLRFGLWTHEHQTPETFVVASKSGSAAPAELVATAARIGVPTGALQRMRDEEAA